jgi:hypothetical protein
VETDLTEERIRDVALPLGLVDVKVCAIDGTWSGLKLVLRKEARGARRTSPRGAPVQNASTRTRSPRSTKRIA